MLIMYTVGSGMCHQVEWQKLTDISEDLTASIIGEEENDEQSKIP